MKHRFLDPRSGKALCNVVLIDSESLVCTERARVFLYGSIFWGGSGQLCTIATLTVPFDFVCASSVDRTAASVREYLNGCEKMCMLPGFIKIVSIQIQ